MVIPIMAMDIILIIHHIIMTRFTMDTIRDITTILTGRDITMVTTTIIIILKDITETPMFITEHEVHVLPVTIIQRGAAGHL
jgi:hypothetical protein